jgi:methionine-gamma-lyase
MENMQIESICAREVSDPRTTAPHILPLYASSSFVFEDIDQGIDIFTGKQEGHVYGRYGNPTLEAVAGKIARLEAAGTGLEAAGLLFSSGQAAVCTMMLALLKQGDKILTQGNLYGGTTELFTKVLEPHGVQTILTDLRDLESVEAMVKQDPGIRMLYFETPANPTLACVDLEALAGIARRHGRISAADNTFATPLLQQPLQHGVDYVIHSTTKFLNGHGNSIAGALVTPHLEQVQKGGAIWTTMKLAGTNCSPWEAWLVHNGLKTLALRMERHSSNALELARFLESHPAVDRVNYCGLPSHPDHALAMRQMRAFGGMLSFELKGGLSAGIRMMNRVRFCTLAPTLGDVDTLILHPASMSHLNIPKEIRLQHGITDGLIRLSTGIENCADIKEDLENAMREL